MDAGTFDAVAPSSATVAISECTGFGQVGKPDSTRALGSRIELYGTTAVRPANLHAARRQLRGRHD